MGQRPLDITFRDLESDLDFDSCAALQRLVWKFQDCDLVTPGMMRSCIKRGGLAIGAFSKDSRLIGFIFGFPVVTKTLNFHHSHMLGTHPDCKDRGVGTHLKQLQKQRLKDKVPLVTWTFDPLESRNAHLNFNKLGIRVRHYYCSLYGENPTSRLHSGIGTDRFLAEWWIDAIKHQLSGDSKSTKISWALRGKSFESKFRFPDEPRLNLEDRILQVEIPGNIQALKRNFPEVASLWREKTRIVLSHYLQNHYQVTGFKSVLDRSQNRISYYQIEKISESSKMNDSAWESGLLAPGIPGKIP